MESEGEVVSEKMELDMICDTESATNDNPNSFENVSLINDLQRNSNGVGEIATSSETCSKEESEASPVIVIKRKRGRKPKNAMQPKAPEQVAAHNFDSLENKEINEGIANIDDSFENSETQSNAIDTTAPRRPGRRKKIYDEDDDPATRKEKIKKRAVELKLNKLKSSFTESLEVSGKRQKKAPQRFELTPSAKPKTADSMLAQGNGQPLGEIRWIVHEVQIAPLNVLRLLHRVMYHRKGLFLEKIIKKNIFRFNGFPFGPNDRDFARRKDILKKLNVTALKQMCQRLCLKPGSSEEMINRIMSFLLRPSSKVVEEFIRERNVAQNQAALLRQTQLASMQKPNDNVTPKPAATHFMPVAIQNEEDEPFPYPVFISLSKIDLSKPWKKPSFFIEGNGIKLKCIRAVVANIEAASEAFVELCHRLLFLNVDEKVYMRRNILEFSGLKCDIGTPNYAYRVQILSVLPVEQLKLICKVFCLPTWHKSRHILTDNIMDFLNLPRIDAMKKRVPPVFSDDTSFSFDNNKSNKSNFSESDEMEEIEIVPDIHIPDENIIHPGMDQFDNEYVGVKLKNFSNIHYQVISHHTSKLSDLHMILYLTSALPRDIRKNILEFSGFAFEENSTEHLCRRSLLEQYSLDDLKRVANILCVSQYICDDSKKSLIDAILKFLLKPSALLSSSTIMPTISHNLVLSNAPAANKVAANSCGESTAVKPDVPVSHNIASANSKDASMKAIIDAIGESETKQELEKVKACLSNAAIEIRPISVPTEVQVSRRKPSRPSKIVQEPESLSNKKKRISTEVYEEGKNSFQVLDRSMDISVSEVKTIAKKPQRSVKKEAEKPYSTVKKDAPPAAPVTYVGSDDDDEPLSKMIGHPNDDQLKTLVSKIMKESRLEDITMKHVLKKVFETFPNFDLNYRKEFIKSNVRLILSQMGDQSCSVSTTVINI